MALNILGTLINGILGPITSILDPQHTTAAAVKATTPATVAQATTPAQVATQAPVQTTAAAAAPAATTQAAPQAAATVAEPAPVAAPTSAAAVVGNGGAASVVGAGSAQTQTQAVANGQTGALLSSVNGNGVASTVPSAIVAVGGSSANINSAGPISLTSVGAGGGGAKTTISLISTFTTTFTSPPRTLTEIIGIEEPNGHTTTITVTGTNTKYLTTTDIISVSPSSVSQSLGGAKSSSNGGTIAGAVIGTLVGFAAVIAAIWYFLQRRKGQRERRILTIANTIGTGGYEKQVDHYSRQPLPPLPEGRTSVQMSESDSRSSNRFSTAAMAARKKLGMSKQVTKPPHVLEWPKEFAAGGLGDDVHEGV